MIVEWRERQPLAIAQAFPYLPTMQNSGRRVGECSQLGRQDFVGGVLEAALERTRTRAAFPARSPPDSEVSSKHWNRNTMAHHSARLRKIYLDLLIIV